MINGRCLNSTSDLANFLLDKGMALNFYFFNFFDRKQKGTAFDDFRFMVK